MKNTVIIIPTRLGAKRFPNKPLAKIKNVPMIIHVLNKAKQSDVGDVLVATPDQQIKDIVEENGGHAVLTKSEHLSGSDRVYEAYKKNTNTEIDLIINLQGDMPNIDPTSIVNLEKFMRNEKCDIGTLASTIKNKDEYSGCTVHFVNSKLDSGKIILQKKIKIKKDDTPKALAKRILSQEHRLYPKAILKVFSL